MATKNTIPFWAAVAITAIVFLPLTMFLGKFNIPLWVSFIVWAEFFTFGANVKDAGKLIIPAFPAGAIICGLGWSASFALVPLLPATGGLWAYWIGFGIFVAILVKLMDYVPVFQKGSLAYFNGMTMVIAVLFTGSFPPLTDNAILTPLVATLWTIIAGMFGLFLGWFNMKITFPRQVKG